MIRITFRTNNDKTAEVPENTNLLRASMRHQGGIPFKCGGGVCGTCKCRIEVGIEHADAVKPKERKHLSDADIAAGFRMACQTFLKGDASVSWEARTPVAKPVAASSEQPAAPTAAITG